MADATRIIDEHTLTILQSVINRAEYLAERQAGSPTDRAILRHILRDLRTVATAVDGALDAAAARALDATVGQRRAA